MSSLKKILIAEDNAVSRKILRKILQDSYSIIEAENGESALTILREQADSVSVVILDIVMPIKDGYDVLKEMQHDKALSKIPVIVASGQDDDESETKALALGANDYIVKPYRPNIIKHKIANTIHLRETAALVNAFQYDALTGLYTKEYFYHRASEMLRDNPNEDFDIICSDIEHFKLVNDLYGIAEGDALLRYIAEIIKKRTADYGICCRMSGDIFAMFVRRPKDYSVDNFNLMAKYVNRFNVNFNVRIKHGIFQVQDKSMPVSIMCDRAYLALKSTKGLFEENYAFYNDTIRQKLLDEQFVAGNMEAALENGEFQVYFQPKYDLKTEKITSAEALVRWIHPERGLIPPNDFIPYLEQNGFITRLDTFVWEEVCKKIRSWLDRESQAVPVSVNMSRADIYNPNIDQILLSLIQKYKINPEYLYLELTETAYMENEQKLIFTLKKLKNLGFTLEMDDFGSGYSSLNMLAELPIDILKLDMRFIQGEQISKSRKNVISFIISLAKWLNMRTVAEGVETAEQIDLLKTLGCERAQGYYYSKPLPADEFEKLLFSSTDSETKAADAKHNETEDTSEHNYPVLLTVDKDEIDFNALKQVMECRYTVVKADVLLEALENAVQQDSLPCAIMITVADNAASDEIINMVKQCNQYDIPVITIHNSNYLIKDCLENGVCDCILRPYAQEVLPNRINNAICSKQISNFQKEKDISLAITEMKRRAEKDSLTGLLNRTEFEIRIQDFFHYNKRPEGIFITLDVDHFKNINDTLGHTVGDSVLCAIANLLHEVFPETNLISRLGGDEFALFIPYMLEQAEVEKKLLQICTSFAVDIGATQVSCSAGMCFSPEFGLDYEELYNNADIALLNAKQRGKSQYAVYEKGLTAPSFAPLEQKAAALLNDVSDAMFVCDAHTNEIIYINNTACRVVHKNKSSCIGARCYELFWDSCKNCDRCLSIDGHTEKYYEEDTVLKDGKTSVHIKAKMGEWDGKTVKIHYLQGL